MTLTSQQYRHVAEVILPDVRVHNLSRLYELSNETGEPMGKILDAALTHYLEVVKVLSEYGSPVKQAEYIIGGGR